MMPRLLALCHGRPMLAVEEDALPMGCSWIEPISSLAPYAFAIVGAVALISLAHSIALSWRTWREIIAEQSAIERN
jgi:hypothetical protein